MTGELSTFLNVQAKNVLTTFFLLNLPFVPLAGLKDSCVSSLVMLRGRERAFLAEDPPCLIAFC